jgi:hypothetical protein
MWKTSQREQVSQGEEAEGRPGLDETFPLSAQPHPPTSAAASTANIDVHNHERETPLTAQPPTTDTAPICITTS